MNTVQVFFFNCLKDLEKAVLVDQNIRTQIKGELSLADLSKSFKFITDKFDEYEKELIVL